MTTLPSPPEVRAILIGVESYPDLGSRFDIPGAAAGVWTFADWLVRTRGVDPKNVQVWLAKEARGAAGIAPLVVQEPFVVPGVERRDLDWTSLQSVLDKPVGRHTSGTFLMVYFCGHGVVGGVRGEQHLVLPHAGLTQLRCIDVANWRAHFHASGWERFEHQLWIIDSCRSNWGQKMVPSPQTWTLGAPKAVSCFVGFSCNLGQEAATDSKRGPRFTRDLVERLKMSGAAWPNFGAALRSIAVEWQKDALLGQNPFIAQDWDGSPLQGNGLADKSLAQILASINWPPTRYRPYLENAARPPGATLPRRATLDEALDFLHGLRNVEGVPPIIDFAERVARATGNEDLRYWLGARLAKQMRAELELRIGRDPVRARLALWYRDDVRGQIPRVEADVEIVDAAGGVQPWHWLEGKTIASSLGEVVAEWVREVEHHISDKPVTLEIDLYLPMDVLLAGPCDSARVGEGPNEFRLGEDCPVLLHCTDRFKSRTWSDRLRQHAPDILARLQPSQPAPLQWVIPGAEAEAIRTDFVRRAPGAPVWLGFDLNEGEASLPFQSALTEGLPAVTWLRLPIDAAERQTILDALPEVLAAPLEGLASRVQRWRKEQPLAVQQRMSVLLDQAQQLPKRFQQYTQP